MKLRIGELGAYEIWESLWLHYNFAIFVLIFVFLSIIGRRSSLILYSCDVILVMFKITMYFYFADQRKMLYILQMVN